MSFTKDRKAININCLDGGNGDIWMRLIGLYTFQKLRPELSINIIIPNRFLEISQIAFKDVLKFNEESKENKTFSFTSLGLTKLWRPILNGQKFVLPFHRWVFLDRKNKKPKAYINIAILNQLNKTNYVNLPDWNCHTYYQGFSDNIGIKCFSNISYDSFLNELKKTYEIISKRMEVIFLDTKMDYPKSLLDNLLVFPTGTGRQFIPINYAKTQLKNAFFAFYEGDKLATEFIDNGLKVILYRNPSEILFLGSKAKKIISTDSFSSHILQFSSYSKNVCILITGTLKSRIVWSNFNGSIIESEASCHPCLHLAKDIHPKCEAGYSECINWKNEKYLNNIKEFLIN